MGLSLPIETIFYIIHSASRQRDPESTSRLVRGSYEDVTRAHGGLLLVVLSEIDEQTIGLVHSRRKYPSRDFLFLFAHLSRIFFGSPLRSLVLGLQPGASRRACSKPKRLYRTFR